MKNGISNILIIGGGVIGLSIARELHFRGAGRIAIIESGAVGREASYAAAGMLAPNAENEAVDDFYRLCDESRAMFPILADELAIETGIDIELNQSGTLYAAFNESDAEHLAVRFSRQHAAGMPVEKLSAAETLKAEPNLSANVRESLYFPNDWQVENRRLLTALEASVRASGIKIMEGARVESVIVENGRAFGVVVDGTPIHVGTVVLATGAWTSLIKIGDTALPIEVKPIRGQMIGFAPPRRFFNRVIYSPRGYLVPRADGRILVGATVENAGFDRSVTAEALRQLRECAVEISSGLREFQISENWAGLRPFAADGLPVIGNVPECGGLIAATAHYRNGILLAPITAKIVVDNIVDGRRSEYFDLFGLDRFKKELNANAS